ncbi:hypothetical protein EV1_027550 [Malus domestica]
MEGYILHDMLLKTSMHWIYQRKRIVILPDCGIELPKVNVNAPTILDSIGYLHQKGNNLLFEMGMGIGIGGSPMCCDEVAAQLTDAQGVLLARFDGLRVGASSLCFTPIPIRWWF